LTRWTGALVASALLVAACDPPPPPLADTPLEVGDVEGVRLVQPTSIVFGSDGRLYAAELLGRIIAITLTADGRSAASFEVIAEAEEFNQVLGLAFDMSDSGPALFLSHNFINGTGEGPFANEIVRLSGPDFEEREVSVAGLPLSGHNHGTNDLEFGADGRLYIAQGGATSSGAPGQPDDPRWRDWDETPLSGAILVADVNAPDFDGRIVYDREVATSDTNLVSGGVTVFSPGHRNTFDIVFHSNGNLYSLDNGSSEPVPASLDCDTLGPPPDNDPDQLNLVVEGAYYGHANRNRGREDPRQCRNLSPFDETIEDNMLRLIPPSSNAIVEVLGTAFPREWQHNLLYAWWSGGEVRRLLLGDDGRTVEGEEIMIQGLSGPISMAQDPSTGTLYIAEFGGGVISYAMPRG
jgi:large repetitive protein